ncbi:MAG: prenyltransferase/squalene oxidase repeat-containing protein [Gemmataceae bacterium]|nr:hypothetical protein [Gemmata sp.]MDW8199196.1 prenyltransferase/squalene oxidase repeat-containing protein [Gemmataceae bacterium]
MIVTPDFLFTEGRSARDDAWFVEVGEVLARGWKAYLERYRYSPPDIPGTWLAWLDSGLPAEAPACAEFVQLLLHQPRPSRLTEQARVLTALARSGYAIHSEWASRIHETLELLFDTCRRDGGWCDALQPQPQQPSCPVVTACVLEALGAFGLRWGQPMAQHAVRFILARQEETGLWTDLWQVFAGLAAVGYDLTAIGVRRAVRGLKELQNDDGGWGTPRSTPGATAVAVLALLIADEPDCPEVQAGAEYLVGTQRADGFWHEATATVLQALGRYLRAVHGPALSELLHDLALGDCPVVRSPHAA